MPALTRTVLHRPRLAASVSLAARDLRAQSHFETRTWWQQLCAIRREKFDRILPEAMRDNGTTSGSPR